MSTSRDRDGYAWPEKEMQRALWLARSTAKRYRQAARSVGYDYEDLVADATLGALQSLKRFDRTRGGLDQWLIYGCRAACIEAIRKHAPMTGAEERAYVAEVKKEGWAEMPRTIQSLDASPNLDTDPVFGEALAYEDPGFRAVEQALSVGALARDALAAIPFSRWRGIVRMYYWDEMSRAGIGRALSISATRVDQLLRQAMTAMRAAIPQEE